jgi:cell fate regulator YaaT (PSP1 superfamily)
MVRSECNSRGYSKSEVDTNKYCKVKNCNKLDVYDWNEDLPATLYNNDIVEVRFKNTRKSFFYNVNNLLLTKGDIVAVEANPGHDIGVVSLVNSLVYSQMKKYKISRDSSEIKKIYRKAKQPDIDKWFEAIELEPVALVKCREIAESLNLQMKIGDVEYQGDKTKAYFYYIAEERVDFRELIKLLADFLKIRVEMKQIGARQEAGRIGGISSCGRELCCTTWLTNFISVTTNAARQQDLSHNPVKLAGQCGKLKCCINFEIDCYIDALKKFPDNSIPLQTKQGTAYYQKSDIFRRIMWYSFDKNSPADLTPVSVDKVVEYIELNKKGIKIDFLTGENIEPTNVVKELGYENVVGTESISRFDDKNKSSKRKKKKKKRNNVINKEN